MPAVIRPTITVAVMPVIALRATAPAWVGPTPRVGAITRAWWPRPVNRAGRWTIVRRRWPTVVAWRGSHVIARRRCYVVATAVRVITTAWPAVGIAINGVHISSVITTTCVRNTRTGQQTQHCYEKNSSIHKRPPGPRGGSNQRRWPASIGNTLIDITSDSGNRARCDWGHNLIQACYTAPLAWLSLQITVPALPSLPVQ